MSKVVQRLLTFFIGLPLVIGIVFLDYWNHMPINALACIVAAIAAGEMFNIFSRKNKLLPKGLLVVLSALLPLSSYFCIRFGHNVEYSIWLFLISGMILMAVEVFTHKTFEESNTRLASSLFIIFYCGFLLTFISRITLFAESTKFLALFLFTVFMNDSLAWLFGVLLGKNNRNVFAASPNKSIAGFIGGFIGAIGSCILAQIIWPEIFSSEYGLFAGVILGFFSACASITGDLIESVMKRSAEIKDSGNIIPGRGGILDCIDSIVFAAPVFYVCVHFLFHPELM